MYKKLISLISVPIQEVEKTQPPEESTDVLQMAFQMASGFTAETVLDMEDNVAPMPVNPGEILKIGVFVFLV